MPCGPSRATLICFSLINHTRLPRTRNYGFVVVVVVEVDDSGGAGGGVTTVVDDDGGAASTTGAGLEVSSTCLWYEKHPVAIAHAAITAGIVTIRCISRIFLNPPSGIYL